jgi:hypothetical protein
MKRALLIAIVLLIGFVFSAMTFAQDKPGATPAKTERIAKFAKGKRGFTGEVVKVDVAENIIVVKGKKCEGTFDIKDVTWKGYKGPDEVKSGDFVVISFMDADGNKIAKRIMKGRKPLEKKAGIKKDRAKPVPDNTAAPASVK